MAFSRMREMLERKIVSLNLDGEKKGGHVLVFGVSRKVYCGAKLKVERLGLRLC